VPVGLDAQRPVRGTKQKEKKGVQPKRGLTTGAGREGDDKIKRARNIRQAEKKRAERVGTKQLRLPLLLVKGEGNHREVLLPEPKKVRAC